MPAPLTTNQPAQLKALATGIDHRYLLGKAEPDEGFLSSLDAALEAKELIKVGLLPACPLKATLLAKDLEQKLGATAVQVIGHVIVLYRRSKKHPTIEV